MSDIYEVLLDQGLPAEILVTDIAKNEKSGKLTISSLTSVHCLSLMENMHGKTFLDRKVFITSVVAASPTKPAPLSTEAGTGQPRAKQTSSGAGSTDSSASGKQTSSSSASAGGPPSTSSAGPTGRQPPGSPPPKTLPAAKSNPTDPHSTQLFTDDSSKNLISPGIQQNDKRKSEFFPDQTAANKEKKRLKEQEKSAKKKKNWKKKQVITSPQHNGH